MTEKEAIEIIKNTPLLRYEGQCGLHSELGDAMRMAVEALEKQTMVNEILHELKEYKILEEQGLLLRLPCKVGDTVYELQEIRKRIQPLEIISVNIGRMGGIYFNWELKDGYGIYQNVRGFGESQLGKNVFLTKAEAEAALEKMKGEEHEYDKR